MEIKKQIVRMYGLMLSAKECFDDMMQGGNKIRKLMEAAEECPVLCQDPQRRHLILFLTPEDRKAAHATAKKIGFESATVVVQEIYVDAKYLKKIKKEDRPHE